MLWSETWAQLFRVMETEMLELSYPVDPDEHDVFDGLELSQLMIQNAACLILPYVNNCRGCLDAMFTKLANQILEDLHRRIENGEKVGFTFSGRPEGPERTEAVAAHLADSGEMIKAFLEGENAHRH